MKINLKELSQNAIEDSSGNNVKMRLSEDASSMVFQLFTKNVYSNPIGTVVREITSNCFDSHIEAKVNSPVIIRKHKDESSGTHYISFIDYGVGMSPDRVNNVYGVYFESTKRVDNTQIGGFGIGAKSILAYKRSTGQGEGEYDNSFFVITVFDKVKYFYCIYEGTESPVISKLHEEPTTERNGTEIQIPVLEKDMPSFSKEMVRQLYYFENIIFEGFENTHQSDTLTNEYQIIRGKSFLFRGEEYSSVIHVCLGRVAYPIDYNVLGLSASDYSLPIALKLEVGDIGVTVSRESLDYSETTIKMLKKKLEIAKAEIFELISKQYQDIQTLEQYFQVKNDFGKLEFPNGKSLYVGNLIAQKDVDFTNFKYQFLKMPNDKQLFRFFFEAKIYGKKPRRSRYSSNNNVFEGGYDDLKRKSCIYYVEDEFNRKIIKQAYLKEEHETYYIIEKRTIGKFMRSEIADLFNVHINDIVDDKGKTLPFIQELREMQEEYFEIVRKNAKDYDQLDIPKDFIASRKRGAGITPDLRKTTIPVKFVGGYSKERVKLSVLFDYNMPIFYGTGDDDYSLGKAVRLFELLFNKNGVVTHCDYQGVLQTGRKSTNQKSTIAFIQIANNNVKYMKYCKNARHIKDFYTYMLPRKENMIIRYFQTHNLVEKWGNIQNFYVDGFINKISDKWGKKVDAIQTLIDAIPDEAKNNDINYYKNDLRQFFKIDNIVLDKEQAKVSKMIDEIEELQNRNKKVLTYFNIPWKVENMEDDQVTILQLAMDLSAVL